MTSIDRLSSVIIGFNSDIFELTSVADTGVINLMLIPGFNWEANFSGKGIWALNFLLLMIWNTPSPIFK